MRISDWSSDVCSSDLGKRNDDAEAVIPHTAIVLRRACRIGRSAAGRAARAMAQTDPQREVHKGFLEVPGARLYYETYGSGPVMLMVPGATGSAYSFQRVREHLAARYTVRSEEHTSELQSLMR